jgi:nucleoside-specific outer membrane channel protein Tsx
MYTVTIEAPTTQDQGMALVAEVEYMREHWSGFKFSRRYLWVKEIVESETVNIGFTNFPLDFTFTDQHQARFFKITFKGTMQ